jgi:tubulin epsilon
MFTVAAGLADEYPEVFRFVAAVFPSEDDDVITSPYNRWAGLVVYHTLLACISFGCPKMNKCSTMCLSRLREHASCVLPVSNDALANIANAIPDNVSKQALLRS